MKVPVYAASLMILFTDAGRAALPGATEKESPRQTPAQLVCTDPGTRKMMLNNLVYSSDGRNLVIYDTKTQVYLGGVIAVSMNIRNYSCAMVLGR